MDYYKSLNYYELLCIERTATKAEIKRAYHSLAKIHHPDKGGDIKKMRQLIEAYEILIVDESRNEYDAKLDSNTISTHGATMNKNGIKITVDCDLTFSERAKHSLKIYEENIAKSANLKFHRTKEESNKRTAFSIKHNLYLDKQKEKIYNYDMYLFDTPIDTRISQCKKSINALNELKEYCLANDGQIYYEDMYEHCHNSRMGDYSWENKLNSYLDFLYEIKYLETNILKILIKKTSIRQIDLIKSFHPDLKPYILTQINNFVTRDIITKEKIKNAYVLTLNVTYPSTS